MVQLSGRLRVDVTVKLIDRHESRWTGFRLSLDADELSLDWWCIFELKRVERSYHDFAPYMDQVGHGEDRYRGDQFATGCISWDQRSRVASDFLRLSYLLTIWQTMILLWSRLILVVLLTVTRTKIACLSCRRTDIDFKLLDVVLLFCKKSTQKDCCVTSRQVKSRTLVNSSLYKRQLHSLTFVFYFLIAAILQRTTVAAGQIRIQGVATCLFLCMDTCGTVYGSVSSQIKRARLSLSYKTDRLKARYYSWLERAFFRTR